MKIGGVNERKSGSKGKVKPRQPRRTKKADRQTSGMHSKNEIMCDYALAPLDRLAHDMDVKWGIDVLVELVSPEMAAKYGSAMAKLNAAIDAADPQEAATRAEICRRGLIAMDEAAEAAGAQRASTDVWEVELEDGVNYAVAKDARSWQVVKEARPDLKVVSMREVAVALEYYSKSVIGHATDEVKRHFPEAEVVAVRSKQYDDDIPF